MKRIGVLTSGGDAPGMNAAIRAVVRTALDKGWEVCGIRYGFTGLLKNQVLPLRARDVGNIMQHGGTMLQTARCPEFRTEEGRAAGLSTLAEHGIEALVVIGGSGSQRGAYALSQSGFPVVGIASTIDNDLYGSEISIGVDTALNIALEAIDRLKVTASSHGRAFLVEVMGRHCGYLALMSGLAGGADAIVIPEFDSNPEELARDVRNTWERGKAHALIVVAEGAKYNAARLAEYFSDNRDRLGFEMRVTTLGHIQRGGTPGAFDRLLATRMGAGAIQMLADGHDGVLMGLLKGEITPTPLSEVVSHNKPLDLRLLELARVLAK